MPEIRKHAIILGLLLLFFHSAARAQAPIDGRYQTSHQSGIIYPLKDDEECPFEDDWPYANGCVESYDAYNQLGIGLNPTGEELHFAAALSFFNGHSCSLSGIAYKTQPNKWVYEEYHDGIEHDMKRHMNCTLDITLTDSDIILNAEEGASCAMYCGARGSFHKVHFPLSSKTQEHMTSEEIDCIAVHTSDKCDALNAYLE